MTTPDQIAIYTTEDGKAHVRLQLQEGSAWLSTRQMGDLFAIGQHAVNHHIREILRGGELDETNCKKLLQQPGHDRSVNHYNLDMILAVGYRVRGPRGAQFRKWATEVLSEYLVKGFAMDDQRLKNDGVDTHFDELLERIRDIRASERQFFRKICDVIAATSADYEERKSFQEVRNFFASIQNRLHFATHGMTAAELIWERADRTKPNAGLTNWSGEQPRRSDLAVAKNYLDRDELTRMNRLTSMFLDYAEDQASLGNTILLDEWMQKADKWLVFNDRDVLSGFGKRQRKQAAVKAHAEWDAHLATQDARVNEKDMAELAEEVKALKSGHSGA
ncbi:RhuM family protein [Corynebacterium frankenforstense]|uniref:RhuM family protein n=1 Tax=Corynebacterium TaxID=1716 RepID=UPI00254C993F|nr:MULTISPECIES: RhuM family protein [Corynebacterium]MDK6259256.1 RhuM family protein [Corynebacterium frankenforstense]MDK8894478.1 RhuM family protein [Corynebacterium sp. MSK006]